MTELTWANLFPGTKQLAVVTAKDAVAHGSVEIRGYAASMFDRQIRNTAPSIELVRAIIAAVGQTSMHRLQSRNDCWLRLAQRQGQIREDFCQEKE